MTSTNRHPGISDSIEPCNGTKLTRRATSRALGDRNSYGGVETSLLADESAGTRLRNLRECAHLNESDSEYEHQCKKRGSNGRVASDGDRHAAMVSYEAG